MRAETKELRGERRLVGQELGRKLTPSEIEVLELVARGHSNPSIGVQLGIRVSTVKNHMNSVLRKLGASDRTSAVLKALGEGYEICPVGSKWRGSLVGTQLMEKISKIENELKEIIGALVDIKKLYDEDGKNEV